MDITLSVAFVEKNGSVLENARFRYILYGEELGTAVIHDFIALQNSDGGFPYAMQKGNLSTVDNALNALWWMEELGLLKSASAENALGYLIATQREDGGWDEDPAITQYDLPPWISPGDLKTRLYLTAYAAYWLAVAGHLSHPACKRALDFLHKHQAGPGFVGAGPGSFGDGTGKFFGYLHTTWIATGAFLMAGSQYSAVAERGLHYLQSRSLAELEASQIAWVLDCLGKAGLPASHPYIEQCLAELVSRQMPDGSWSAEDGEAFAVGATIAALKALMLYRHIQV